MSRHQRNVKLKGEGYSFGLYVGNTFIELIQFENYMRGNIMKKIMVLSLIAVCAITDVYAKGKMAVIADTLPQIKKDIAGKLEKCLLSPEQGSGNDYVNVCYGEAADGFLHVGNRYVNLSLARADNKLLKEEIRKDQLFLKQQIQQCDEFQGASVPPAQKLNWITICKLQRSQAYAEYFYRPSDVEIKKDKKYSQSWNVFVKETVKSLIGN